MPLRAFAAATLLIFFWYSASGDAAATKARHLAQWKELTSSNAPAPKVFVKDRTVRLYFQENGKAQSWAGGPRSTAPHTSHTSSPGSNSEQDSAAVERRPPSTETLHLF